MNEEISAFVTILEHPNIKKGYINYLNYLKSKNRQDEARAFEYLIEKKFNDNSTNNSTK